MRCGGLAMCVGLLLFACGGATRPSAVPAAEEADGGVVDEQPGSDLAHTCSDLCRRLGELCAGDPAAASAADSCAESCLDETDEVIDEAKGCLEAAASCAAAAGCRELLGD